MECTCTRRRGRLYQPLHKKKRQAVPAFAEDLIADSCSSVDFTVQVYTVIDDLLGDVTIQTFHSVLCVP